MGGWPARWSVEVVDETGSTNADLLARGVACTDRTVRMAWHQTAGRGRLDRVWEAPPGANLLFSVLFTEVPEVVVELTHRMGLAVVQAAAQIAGVRAGLKWPNDVLVGDAKLAGILAQRSGSAVVVGTGVNVNWAPEGAARLGEEISPVEVLAAILTAFDALPAEIDGLYREHLATLGRQVRVLRNGDEIIGRALKVEPTGELVVLDACGISHRCDVGDVIHLRPAED